MPRKKEGAASPPKLRPPMVEIFAARQKRRKTLADSWPDFLTSQFGTIWFLNLNVIFFAAWIVINLGFIPGVPVFDPYPFGMLTMCVSLEAIFLSTIVLISQKRAAEVDDLREEVDLQVNIQAEREITRVLHMLDAIHRKLGIRRGKQANDEWMREDLDLDALENRVKEVIRGR